MNKAARFAFRAKISALCAIPIQNIKKYSILILRQYI